MELLQVHTVFMIRGYGPPETSLATEFLSSVKPYLMFLINLPVTSQWWTMRKVEVTIEKRSDHAMVVMFSRVRAAITRWTSRIYVNMYVMPRVWWCSVENITDTDVWETGLLKK